MACAGGTSCGRMFLSSLLVLFAMNNLYVLHLSREGYGFLLMNGGSIHAWRKTPTYPVWFDELFKVTPLFIQEDLSDWVREVSYTAIEGKVPIVEFEGLRLLRVQDKALDKAALILNR